MTVKSKKPKKRTPTKKRSTKALQSNIGKGPNININIDQSRKTTKKAGTQQQQAQPRQQIISTFTPVHAPPPPIYNFPLPTNLNPFEAATKATQKTNIQEQNELEKPKPKTKQTSEGFAQTDDIPEATFIEPVQFIESFPVRDEMPLVKPIRIKPPHSDASTQIMETKPHKERYNRSIQTDNPITKAIATNTEEEPRQRTPLEQPVEERALVVIPKIKSNRQSNIMTMQDLNNENETKPVKNLIPFIGIGNRLNKDEILNRFSREEMRRKRIEALEQNKNKEIIPVVKKPVINEPEEKQTIETLDIGLTPDEIEKLKEKTSKYRQAEQQPEPQQEEEELNEYEKYQKFLDSIKTDFNKLKKEAKKQNISTTREGHKKGSKTKTEIYEELLHKYSKVHKDVPIEKEEEEESAEDFYRRIKREASKNSNDIINRGEERINKGFWNK